MHSHSTSRPSALATATDRAASREVLPTPVSETVCSAPSAGEALAETKALLNDRRLGSSREATLLLAHVLGTTEAHLLAHPETPLSGEESRHFQELIRRRLDDEPVAYLVGRREFWGRSFVVDRRVLVPRPETEHLIETVLDLELPKGTRALDVGTGSGCIALTLALERPDWILWGSDLSPAALAVASINEKQLRPTRAVRWLAGSLLQALELQRLELHLIVANLPYIDPRHRPTLPRDVRDYEPEPALFADHEGLGAILRLLRQASRAPRPPVVVVEVGAGQKPALEKCAAQHGFHVSRISQDLRGIDRVICLKHRPGAAG